MSKPLLPSEKEVLLWQDKTEKAVLKMLEKHYKDALKDIEEKITAMMGRQDANLPHVIRRIEYQRMLKEQLQTALERLHSNEYETISEYLKDSYTDAFVGTVYTLHKQDVPVILPVDQSVVVKAVTIDSKLKESLYTSIGKDITELKRSIAAEVTRGIASGMMYSDIARNIRDVASIPMKRAKTIARTEAGRVQEQATFDAAKEAKAVGADVVKQWSAIRDSKTRDSHRKLDGQIREINEPFEVNGHKGMHPHDFGRPEEDINCRCTMLTRARAALGEDELAKLKERAEFFGLDKTKEFEDFKKKYMKAAQEESKYSGLSFMDKKKLIYDNEKEIEKLQEQKKAEEFKLIMASNVEEMEAAQQKVKSVKALIDEKKAEILTIQNELGIPTNAKERFYDQKVDASKLPHDIRDSELGAIGTWTRTGYTQINSYKRTGNKGVYSGIIKDAETLEKMIDRNVVTEPFTVKRGTDENAVNHLFGNANWKDAAFRSNGRVIQDNGFMATTPLKGGGFGGDVQMFIDVPVGAKGVYIGKQSAAPNEKEFLLQSGTCFVVDRIEEWKDKWGESHYDLYLRVIVDEQ